MTPHKSSLSVSMIVKNEERHLARLLASVAQFADEIVIVDTGSSDRTKHIALGYGVKLFDFAWCDDFAQARNKSLRYCTKDFVMWLDADDLIEQESVQYLQQLLLSPIEWDVLYLPYYCHYSPENKSKGKRKMPPRIWRNHMGINWRSPIHEYLVYPKGAVKKRDTSGIEILHHPLRAESGSSDRNLRIMKRTLWANPNHDDYFMLWHIAKEHSLLSNRRQAAYFYQKAIENYKGADELITSRLYVGLAKQQRKLGDFLAALESAAKAAIAYHAWREPYCEMAEDYFLLGDSAAGEACLKLSRDIPLHDRQVERAELYEPTSFREFCTRLRAATAARPQSKIASTAPVRILAGGDVCLARQLPGLVDLKGSSWCFKELKTTLQQADMVLVNLESAITTGGDFLDKQERRPYYYRARPEMLDVLSSVGINVVNIANNHAMDFGPEAFDQELEILDACGIAQCGGGRNKQEAAQPCYINAGGLVIACIGIHTETPMMSAGINRVGINHSPEELLLHAITASVALAKCHADIIIVTPHWGANWKDRPSENRRTLARQIIDLGVDAILGHSAHILQGIEIYKGCPIVYDMGTLLFDRTSQDRMKLSALFEIEIAADGTRNLTIIPILLHKGRASKAEGATAAQVRALLGELSDELYPGTTFNTVGENLHIALPCESKPAYRRSSTASPCYSRTGMRRTPDFYRDLKSNVIHDSVPEAYRWPSPLTLGKDTQILGARIDGPVRPGRGFLCEIYFRTEKPAQGRWEARILAHMSNNTNTLSNEAVFEYIHPVAEGIWPQSRWKKDDIICDRIVIRPPKEVPEGNYTLSWQLIDRDNVAPLSTLATNEAVAIGEISIISSAPAGVGGIAQKWLQHG